jgi:hypothetical protein
MIYVEIMGGLGNQLFQIFCGIAYSIENKVQFKINANKYDVLQRPTYFKNFLKNLSEFIIHETLSIQTYRENLEFTFEKIPTMTQDFVLYGYYQSYKYFNNHFDDICKMIDLNSQQETIFKKNNLLLSGAKKPISIHFRIGDYIHIKNTHPILNIEYYIDSIHYLKTKLPNFEENYYLLIFGEFCDDMQIMYNIEIIKNHTNIEIIKCDYNIPDYEQLLLMSLCSHNIIANSTFSWWGAYLNKNCNKIVCYPSKWIGFTDNVLDLFPETWTNTPQRVLP